MASAPATLRVGDSVSLHSAEVKYFPDLAFAALEFNGVFFNSVAVQLRRKGFGGVKADWAIALHRMADRTWRSSDLREIFGSENAAYPIKKLASAGYVELARCETDARVVLVSRTDAGRRVAEVVQDVLDRPDQAVVERARGASIKGGDVARSASLLEQLAVVLRAQQRGHD